jgi:hypothetical protein
MKAEELIKESVNGVDISSLSSEEQSAMRTHAGHHTEQHLVYMKDLMTQGIDFGSAHEQAMMEVGK